jgi:16S rRNA (uracil1498-N3)-methyltransferase
MKQFILPSPPDSHGIIRLSGKDFHYLVRVRRLREGAVFNALLPGGEEVRVLVQSLAGSCLIGECLPAELINERSLPPIFLFQALPKGSKMDLIVRQAAEGGINGIWPFVSDFAIPKLAAAPSGPHGKPHANEVCLSGPDLAGTGRMERWRRIIKEARQQSGSAIATEIALPCTVEALLDHWGDMQKQGNRPLGIILHQDPLEPDRSLGSTGPLAQGSFHDYLSINPDLVALAVGPEGGFSPEEVLKFLTAGFKPLVIANTVLRTETAALYAAAAVRIILLENTTWTLTIPRR